MKFFITLINILKTFVNILNRVIGRSERPFKFIYHKLAAFLSPLWKPVKGLSVSIWALIKKLGFLVFMRTLLIACITLTAGKLYQHFGDTDSQRGAVAVLETSYGESYTTPVYIKTKEGKPGQGWSESDSLWFYNTTQGSNLLPYDLFVELEQVDSEELFRSDANVDKFRYLPQKPTNFNPDGLPVGFVKDTYDNKDYVGYTCAACHTGQINVKRKFPKANEPKMHAVRIDGGAAMADMDGFLEGMEKALTATLEDKQKQDRFIKRVLERDNFWRGIFAGRGYKNADQVRDDLEIWTNRIQNYNLMNASDVHYGYARLDAFGRIFNRVLEHVMNQEQVANKLAFITRDEDGKELPILTTAQIDNVVSGLGGEIILGQAGFEKIVKRLQSKEPGFPSLNEGDTKLVIDNLFNPADAPVSYPFLWDIAQSDYVQWNGLAANAGLGPLGRNTGEVLGVFGSLDWQEDKFTWWDPREWFRSFSLPAKISGQSNKQKYISFKSSVDKVNLQRLENKLTELTSPKWEDVEFADGTGLPEIDTSITGRGKQVYARYCQSCHELIVKDDWSRKVVAKMLAVDKVGTDPKMAVNSTTYTGESGNFAHTYQDTEVGPIIMEQEAPVVQILTAATKGVIATPDADKLWVRRVADWFYTLGASLFDNDIKPSVKSGDYEPDTTANPYASLMAYKGRPLNGIWATAPYLHNGSVPTLYDLLLPVESRPQSFYLGCRELDTSRVGNACPEGTGFLFDTSKEGNSNKGHEYAAGRTNQLDGKPLPPLDQPDRLALLEFLKTL